MQRLRLEQLNAADWKCSWCRAADKNLQIHHGYYGKGMEPWEYHPDSLHVLCHHCHEQAESLRTQVLEQLGHLPPQYHHHAFYGVSDLLARIGEGEVIDSLDPWSPDEEKAA